MISGLRFSGIYAAPATKPADMVQKLLTAQGNIDPKTPKPSAEELKKLEAELGAELKARFEQERQVFSKVLNIPPNEIIDADSFMKVTVAPSKNISAEEISPESYVLTGADMKAVQDVIQSRLKK